MRTSGLHIEWVGSLVALLALKPNRYSWCHDCWVTLIMFLYIAVSDETLA